MFPPYKLNNASNKPIVKNAPVGVTNKVLGNMLVLGKIFDMIVDS